MSRDLTIDQRSRTTARVTDSGRSVLSIPKVQRFLEHMLLGQKITDAALAAGLRANRARRLMSDPVVRREFLRRCELLAEGERPRNHLLLTTIRDRGLAEGATAAQQKVATEAVRLMSGEAEKQGGLTINGGNNVIAGYVIRLPAVGEGPRKIVPHAAVARDIEDV